MNHQPVYQKYAIILSTLLLLLLLFSIILIHSSQTNGKRLLADIYQDGVLLQSIDLHAVQAPYTFTIQGKNHCVNEIEVRQGSIGIISANCPDKLCVHQGFIQNSKLPITCLPNHLVIQIRTNVEQTSDITTY